MNFQAYVRKAALVDVLTHDRGIKVEIHPPSVHAIQIIQIIFERLATTDVLVVAGASTTAEHVAEFDFPYDVNLKLGLLGGSFGQEAHEHTFDEPVCWIAIVLSGNARVT